MYFRFGVVLTTLSALYTNLSVKSIFSYCGFLNNISSKTSRLYPIIALIEDDRKSITDQGKNSNQLTVAVYEVSFWGSFLGVDELR